MEASITVADLVVPVPVRSGSIPELIGRHLKLSADTYKSDSVSFELHNCRPIVINVNRQQQSSKLNWICYSCRPKLPADSFKYNSVLSFVALSF